MYLGCPAKMGARGGLFAGLSTTSRVGARHHASWASHLKLPTVRILGRIDAAGRQPSASKLCSPFLVVWPAGENTGLPGTMVKEDGTAHVLCQALL